MDPGEEAALIKAIRHLHGCDATWEESVPVHEIFMGKTVWAGHVKVFNLSGHPTCDRAYAWSYEVGDDGRRRFYAVLHSGPIDSPLKAVQAVILTGVYSE